MPVSSRFWMTRNGCPFEEGEFSQYVHAVVSVTVPSEMAKAMKQAVTIALRVLVYQVTTGLEPPAGHWEVSVWCKAAMSCAGGGCSCLLNT